MYTLKMFMLGFSLLSFAGQSESGSFSESSSSSSEFYSRPFDNHIGIYVSPDDFARNQLSYAGDCTGGNCQVRLHELFGSSTVDLICNGKKRSFAKDKIYGYRDCKDLNYRFLGQSSYQILDTAGFYLYSINKLVQGEKIARPQTLYYFSVPPNGPVQELTLANLERSFAGNAKFRYHLEAQFKSDKGLIAYDDLLKTYKIKYLYSQSYK
jgi:hypothetical protein